MRTFTFQSPQTFTRLPRLGTSALFATLATAIIAASPASAARRWEMTGTLNVVHSALSGTFTNGQTFTITLDMDENAPMRPGERISSTLSSGAYGQAVSNGNVTFPNYTMTFASQPDIIMPGGSVTQGDGDVQVLNGQTNANPSVAYDKLDLSFTTQHGGVVSAPQIAGHDVVNLGLSFFSDSSPLNMIIGTDAASPAIDAPFPTPDSFNLARSTNSPFHFYLSFTGGDPEGSIFIGGSINSLTFSEVGGAGGGFAEWPALATAPADQRGPNDTPAGDGVANIIKYALGISPLESANARLPSKVVEGQGGDVGFPVVSFIRVKDLTGTPIEVEVSANLDFSTSLGTTVINTEDLGDGTERITVRSNASFSSQTKQFFRLKVTGT